MTTQEILEAARAAKQAVALASSRTRQSVLERMADALCAPDSVEAILAANAEDMAAAKGHISDVMLDRLALTPERIGAMAKGILEVAARPGGRGPEPGGAPQRAGDRKDRRAHGRHCHHLREPPQRDQ